MKRLKINYLSDRVVVGSKGWWYTNIRDHGHSHSPHARGGHTSHSMGNAGGNGSLNGPLAADGIWSFVGFLASFSVVKWLHVL